MIEKLAKTYSGRGGCRNGREVSGVGGASNNDDIGSRNGDGAIGKNKRHSCGSRHAGSGGME